MGILFLEKIEKGPKKTFRGRSVVMNNYGGKRST